MSSTLDAYYQRSSNFAKRVEKTFTETTVSPHWIIGSSSTFWYRQATAPGKFAFIFADAEQGVRRHAFDHERLAKALNGEGVKADANALPFDWIEPSKDGQVINFRTGEKKWQFRDNGTLTEYEGDINEETLKPLREEKASDRAPSNGTSITFVNRTKGPISIFWIDWDSNAKHYVTVEEGKSNRRPTYTGHVWRVTNAKTDESIASFIAQDNESTATIEGGMSSTTEENEKPTEKDSVKPEKQRKVFVKDYNVWFRDNDDQEFQLSKSGTKENPFDKDNIYKSPDGRFAVIYQYTPEQEHMVYQVESSPEDQVQPRLKKFQYLKPGDKVRIDRPRMFDLLEKKEVATDDSLFQNPFDITDMERNSNSREYRFLYNQRGHQLLRLVGMGMQGHTRIILEDTSKTFVDYSQKGYSHETKDSNEIIWASERDGRIHLYLFDLTTGSIKNQITQGEWVMRSVDKVDEEKRQIWFRAFGIVKDQDPYYAHLVRVNFDGSGLTVLTEGDGTHTWKWTPDRRYLIDTWSRVDLAPKTVLRNGETGTQIMVLEEVVSRTYWR